MEDRVFVVCFLVNDLDDDFFLDLRFLRFFNLRLLKYNERCLVNLNSPNLFLKLICRILGMIKMLLKPL